MPTEGRVGWWTAKKRVHAYSQEVFGIQPSMEVLIIYLATTISKVVAVLYCYHYYFNLVVKYSCSGPGTFVHYFMQPSQLFDKGNNKTHSVTPMSLYKSGNELTTEKLG